MGRSYIVKHRVEEFTFPFIKTSIFFNFTSLLLIFRHYRDTNGLLQTRLRHSQTREETGNRIISHHEYSDFTNVQFSSINFTLYLRFTHRPCINITRFFFFLSIGYHNYFEKERERERKKKESEFSDKVCRKVVEDNDRRFIGLKNDSWDHYRHGGKLIIMNGSREIGY